MNCSTNKLQMCYLNINSGLFVFTYCPETLLRISSTVRSTILPLPGQLLISMALKKCLGLIQKWKFGEKWLNSPPQTISTGSSAIICNRFGFHGFGFHGAFSSIYWGRKRCNF